MEKQTARVHPYRVVLFTVAVLVVLRALPKLDMVGFALFLTIVFALLLDAPVSFLERWRVPRAAATTGVLLAALGAIGGTIALIVPTVVAEAKELLQGHQALGAELAARANQAAARLPVDVPEVRPEHLEADRLLESLGGMSLVTSTGSVLALVVVSLFAAVWAVANPQPLQQRLLAFVVPRRRSQVAGIAKAVEERLRRWLLGQLVLSFAVGLSTYVLLRALGVPFAAVFAVAAGILESVPTLGVVLAAVGPLVVLGLEDPSKVVWLLLGIAVIQQLEDRLLVPIVMKRALDIPQTLLVFVMLAAGALFGPVGLVMAVPLTAAAITIHDAVMAYDKDQPEVTSDAETTPAAVAVELPVARTSEDTPSVTAAETA